VSGLGERAVLFKYLHDLATSDDVVLLAKLA
jgi:hypothetical protein